MKTPVVIDLPNDIVEKISWIGWTFLDLFSPELIYLSICFLWKLCSCLVYIFYFQYALKILDSLKGVVASFDLSDEFAIDEGRIVRYDVNDLLSTWVAMVVPSLFIISQALYRGR